MSFADEYLARRHFVPRISDPPAQCPGIIAVVPCCNEPDLLRSLQSLHEAATPGCFTEVIIVINHAENANREVKQQNERSWHVARIWANDHCSRYLRFHPIIVPDVPAKDAGVGFARKTGMDEAAYRFNLSDADDGVIVAFDADAVCDTNYLVEIERCFARPQVNGASIYYEHPVEGREFTPDIYEGAILYELHLRYLNQAMRYAGFPYAYHTVGSSFAVRASAYVKQGGMNKRKAGEDFHFLHKIIPLGNYAEINTTRVIPSPRISDRVPFGTGASIRRWMREGQTALYTYPVELFDGLKAFFALVSGFYPFDAEKIRQLCASLPVPMQVYLEANDYLGQIAAVCRNSSSAERFQKRFPTWFGGLHIVKYLNYGCGDYFVKQPAGEAATALLHRLNYRNIPSSDKELLFLYRAIERSGYVHESPK
ncbi:MAG: glycosyltransferase family 2 protein [Bacteroidales bacterium]|jgi:cellulose synthase/poly-beta-1,6-N-acetylglucosamine synthase-like glycosyltransferase|nr:glycosyltransferase family 2 protein [Bacteroidales bacterium]